MMARRIGRLSPADVVQAFRSGGSAGRSLRTTAERSKIMAGVRRIGTTPELAVRDALRGLGVRFTTDNADLPGSPDLANRRRHFAVFVHGCFWHRHANCRRTTTPSHNREFWSAKFEANVRRDRRVTRSLRRLGFRVIVVWECRTRNPVALSLRIRRLLESG